MKLGTRSLPDGSGERPLSIAAAYLLSCVAGAVAMLVFYSAAGGHLLPIHIAAATAFGIGGGSVALPVAYPLILAAERWQWRNPLIYLVSSAMMFVVADVLGILVVVFTPLAALVGPPDERIGDTGLVQAYLLSTVAATTTYWVLRGRMSGALC